MNELKKKTVRFITILLDLMKISLLEKDESDLSVNELIFGLSLLAICMINVLRKKKKRKEKVDFYQKLCFVFEEKQTNNNMNLNNEFKSILFSTSSLITHL